MLVLKLPPFFPCRVSEGKRAAISSQTCFSQKRVRSYIVLALDIMQSFKNAFHFFQERNGNMFLFSKEERGTERIPRISGTKFAFDSHGKATILKSKNTKSFFQKLLLFIKISCKYLHLGT